MVKIVEFITKLKLEKIIRHLMLYLIVIIYLVILYLLLLCIIHFVKRYIATIHVHSSCTFREIYIFCNNKFKFVRIFAK